MLNYVENECFMYKFEIKQGYYNIDIKPGHQKYLGFENKWKSFLFCVYCLTIWFNFSLVLISLTKIMRVLVKHRRENNVKICCCQFRICKKFSNTVQVVVSQDKYAWCPITNMTWVGITSKDFDSKVFFIPDKKTSSISTMTKIKKNYSISSLCNCSNII